MSRSTLRRSRPGRRAVIATLLALAGTGSATGCLFAAPGPPPPESAYPGSLRPVEALGPDLMWRQRVTSIYDGAERGFDSVLQKRGDVLTMVALTPFGSPAFVVTLQGGDVALDNRMGEELPFAPRYIILDVQRIFARWLDGEPPTDGERAGEVDGERIVERYRDGHLVERRFERIDGVPAGAIVARYEGWTEAARAPAHVELDNGWFGYRFLIETLEQQDL